MQRLVPVPVPWQVSPSTPYLRLTMNEAWSEDPTNVTFVAHHGLRVPSKPAASVGPESVVVSSNPYDLINSDGERSETHSVVRITFDGAAHHARMSGYPYEDRLDPELFEETELLGLSDEMDVERWGRERDRIWLESGHCPTPNFYRVENSHWLKEFNSTGYEHYLIRGHDAYAEVVAKGWKWEEVGSLPIWW